MPGIQEKLQQSQVSAQAGVAMSSRTCSPLPVEQHFRDETLQPRGVARMEEVCVPSSLPWEFAICKTFLTCLSCVLVSLVLFYYFQINILSLTFKARNRFHGLEDVSVK